MMVGMLMASPRTLLVVDQAVKECSEAGCRKRARAGGLCRLHYDRRYREANRERLLMLERQRRKLVAMPVRPVLLVVLCPRCACRFGLPSAALGCTELCPRCDRPVLVVASIGEDGRVSGGVAAIAG
ncbi:MAG TPA: hypothetical protein VIU87_16870 [Mycobacterium sp.]